MKKYYRGNVLLVTLLILVSVLGFLFMGKEKMVTHQKHRLNNYQNYLNSRFQMTNPIKFEDECHRQRKDKITYYYKMITYQFYCERIPLFVERKNEKYVEAKDIRRFIDVDTYQNEIISITSLAYLPATSEEEPKIVKLLNDIDETLNQHFYGIIITDFSFKFKGGYKIYGSLYSSYDNSHLAKERNLTYKGYSHVIDRLEQQISQWKYLPHSRNILANE